MSGAISSKSAPATSEPALNISLMWPGVFTTVASSASPSTSLLGSSMGRTTRPRSRSSWGACGGPRSGAMSSEKSTFASSGIHRVQPPRDFLVDDFFDQTVSGLPPRPRPSPGEEDSPGDEHGPLCREDDEHDCRTQFAPCERECPDDGARKRTRMLTRGTSKLTYSFAFE